MKLCKYFVESSCKNGDKCELSHDLQAFAKYQISNGVCKAAVVNKCKFGVTCKFSHDPLMILQYKNA